MKIAILGAGAIGGLIGAKLAQTRVELSLIARGPHLEAMQDNGITLLDPDGYVNLDPIVAGTTAFLGPQDCVFVTLHATQLPGALDLIAPLLGAHTTVVWAAAGLPFWDGQEAVFEMIPPASVLGCLPLLRADILQPGVIRHLAGDTVLLGEVSDATSPRAHALSAVLKDAGLVATVVPDIREQLWSELAATLACAPEDLEQLVSRARAVASSFGVEIGPVEDGGCDVMWRRLADGNSAEVEAVLRALGA